jgi:hypothetical protein
MSLGTLTSLHGLETAVIIHDKRNVKHFKPLHPSFRILLLCIIYPRVLLRVIWHCSAFCDTLPRLTPLSVAVKSDTMRRIMLPIFSHLQAHLSHGPRDSKSCKCVLIGSRMHGRYSATLVTYCFSALLIASVSLFQPSYYRLPLCVPSQSPDMHIGVDVSPSSFPSLVERMSWS